MAAHRDYARRAYDEVSREFDSVNPTIENLAHLQLLNASLKKAMRLYPANILALPLIDIPRG